MSMETVCSISCGEEAAAERNNPVGERHCRSLIRLVKTEYGFYGMHGSTKWDDYPFTIWCTAWGVMSETEGRWHWGPFRYNRKSNRTHEATGTVRLHHHILFVEDPDYNHILTIGRTGVKLCEDRTNSGQSGINDYLKKRAEDYLLLVWANLEEKGFQVDIGELYENPGKLEHRIEFLSHEPPKFVIRRLGQQCRNSYELPTPFDIEK